MKVDIKICRDIPGLTLPRYATNGSAAVDLVAAIDKPIQLPPGHSVVIPSGFAMSIPAGLHGHIVPRSGLGMRDGIVISNTVGIIDSDYTGEIKLSIMNRNRLDYPVIFEIEPLDRICQMLFIPVVQVAFNQVDELAATERGAGGFGSTGVKGAA